MTFEEIRFIIDRTAAFLGDFFVGRGDVDQLGGPVKVARCPAKSPPRRHRADQPDGAAVAKHR
jgi:hypothetical protein